jgi:hypothetical protein
MSTLDACLQRDKKPEFKEATRSWPLSPAPTKPEKTAVGYKMALPTGRPVGDVRIDTRNGKLGFYAFTTKEAYFYEMPTGPRQNFKTKPDGAQSAYLVRIPSPPNEDFIKLLFPAGGAAGGAFGGVNIRVLDVNFTTIDRFNGAPDASAYHMITGTPVPKEEFQKVVYAWTRQRAEDLKKQVEQQPESYLVSCNLLTAKQSYNDCDDLTKEHADFGPLLQQVKDRLDGIRAAALKQHPKKP